MYESGLYVRAIQLAKTGLDILTSQDSETSLLQADLWTTMGGGLSCLRQIPKTPILASITL